MKRLIIKTTIDLLLYFFGTVFLANSNFIDDDELFILLIIGALVAVRFRIMPYYEKNKKDMPQE